MYESYSKQCLPSKNYRELIGTGICVFNSVNMFIIENILRIDNDETYDWHTLVDFTSGQLLKPVKDTITKATDKSIAREFEEIIQIRNRIAHSFQITVEQGNTDDPDNQMLATKYKDGTQELITEDFLINFINKNDELSSKLHALRGY